MTPITAIIVDDEEPGRSNLEDLIVRYCPGISILGKAASAAEARALIQASPPDLIFLDIEMPNETGIELADSLGNFSCNIIFVTAYEQYAIKAIKLSAVDYIMKPISIRELQLAIQKVRSKIKAERNKLHEPILHDTDDINKLRDNGQYLSLPGLGNYEIIHKQSIIRLEGDSNYTTVVTTKRDYLIAKTLRDFEQLLDSNQFIRIHKTHIINLQYLAQVQHQGGGVVVMNNGTKISISRRRYTEFMSHLSQFAPIVR